MKIFSAKSFLISICVVVSTAWAEANTSPVRKQPTQEQTVHVVSAATTLVSTTPKRQDVTTQSEEQDGKNREGWVIIGRRNASLISAGIAVISLSVSFFTSLVYNLFLRKKKEQHELDIKFFGARKEIYEIFLRTYYLIECWFEVNEKFLQNEGEKQISELMRMVQEVKVANEMVRYAYVSDDEFNVDKEKESDIVKSANDFCMAIEKSANAIKSLWFSESKSCNAFNNLSFSQSNELHKKILVNYGTGERAEKLAQLTNQEIIKKFKEEFESQIRKFLKNVSKRV